MEEHISLQHVPNEMNRKMPRNWLRFGIGHHPLELLEANKPIAVGINGLDHLGALFDGASLAKPAQDLVQLGGGYATVLVLIVELEGVVELLETTVVGGASAPDFANPGELLQVDESVVVGVKFLHHAADFLLRGVGSEGLHDPSELGSGDLAVAVGVEAFEDPFHFVDVLEIP
ncbi:hypothetical protein RJ640_000640 [Escallonia rubra]|uniref:Uncharacterized protein n=1 Tax=Escallonia rubra TaxID=112253 RepID=A0AA88QMB8_9ASTE|nr:hypothetical protein RJ640_000640 [Escallonia rubra]